MTVRASFELDRKLALAFYKQHRQKHFSVNAHCVNSMKRPFGSMPSIQDAPYDLESSSGRSYTRKKPYNVMGGSQSLAALTMSNFQDDELPAMNECASSSLRTFANPTPLGLCAFALTTFVLSLINIQARGVQTNDIVLGLALFYGGLVQLLAGMWEYACGNTFVATALSSYGGFWLSFACIAIPSFNVASAYESKQELNNALGFYLLGWAIFTFILLLCTLRTSVALFSLFLMLDIAFLCLSIAHLKNGARLWTKIGGGFGLAAAALAWYNAFSMLFTAKTGFFDVPVGHFPWSVENRRPVTSQKFA